MDARIIELITTPAERDARKSLFCGGCGKDKDLGLVVCWICFRVDGVRPAYKYYAGTLEEWLAL